MKTHIVSSKHYIKEQETDRVKRDTHGLPAKLEPLKAGFVGLADPHAGKSRVWVQVLGSSLLVVGDTDKGGRVHAGMRLATAPSSRTCSREKKKGVLYDHQEAGKCR